MKKLIFLSMVNIALISCGDNSGSQADSRGDTSGTINSGTPAAPTDTSVKAMDSSTGVTGSTTPVGASDGSNNSAAVGGSINSSGNKAISGTGGASDTSSVHGKGGKKVK